MKTAFSLAPALSAAALLALLAGSLPSQAASSRSSKSWKPAPRTAPAIYWEDESFTKEARGRENAEDRSEANTFDRHFPGFEDVSFEDKDLDTVEVDARPARPVRYESARYGFSRTPRRSRPNGASAAEKARQILDLLNGERTQRGLRPLVWDGKLAQAALRHSQDMVRRNYFSHFSPEGESVTERVVATGADWRALGENLASNFSVKGAHTALMNSTGHRRSILKPNYGRVGIGVVSSPGQIMVTQVFAD